MGDSIYRYTRNLDWTSGSLRSFDLDIWSFDWETHHPYEFLTLLPVICGRTIIFPWVTFYHHIPIYQPTVLMPSIWSLACLRHSCSPTFFSCGPKTRPQALWQSRLPLLRWIAMADCDVLQHRQRRPASAVRHTAGFSSVSFWWLKAPSFSVFTCVSTWHGLTQIRLTSNMRQCWFGETRHWLSCRIFPMFVCIK